MPDENAFTMGASSSVPVCVMLRRHFLKIGALGVIAASNRRSFAATPSAVDMEIAGQACTVVISLDRWNTLLKGARVSIVTRNGYADVLTDTLRNAPPGVPAPIGSTGRISFTNILLVPKSLIRVRVHLEDGSQHSPTCAAPALIPVLQHLLVIPLKDVSSSDAQSSGDDSTFIRPGSFQDFDTLSVQLCDQQPDIRA